METNMVKILEQMTNAKLEYFVLRDYETEKRINESTDVDMYVSKKDIDKVIKILSENGFIRQKLSPCKYPHMQFKKVSNRIYRMDIVTDFYYGYNEYHYDASFMLKNTKSRVTSFGVSIPDCHLAVYTMLLHILFDKAEFSDKNYKLIRKMIKELKQENFSHPVLEEIINEVNELTISKCNDNIKNYQDRILSSGILKKVPLKYIYNINCTMKKIMSASLRRIKRNNIAITGVDGSGKSAAVEELKKIYGDDAVIVYMGLKGFKFKFCDKYTKLEKYSSLDKIKYRILLYIDYLSRYYKFRFSPKLVIFDRYTDDILANSKKYLKIFDHLFYKVLFPQPKLKFYLYCDAETSINRKDDISNVDEFIKYKKSYDKYSKNNKKTKIINTDINNKCQVIEKITEEINKINYNN